MSGEMQKILSLSSSTVLTSLLLEILLRKPDEERVIWIDAICIDQLIIQERSYKVSIMAKIYGKAESLQE